MDYGTIFGARLSMIILLCHFFVKAGRGSANEVGKCYVIEYRVEPTHPTHGKEIIKLVQVFEKLLFIEVQRCPFWYTKFKGIQFQTYDFITRKLY